jgi:hypothetical protein
LLTLALVTPGPAQAQATRTWVSGVGNDANPCSRTAPCKTFAGAISKTVAGGEISVLDPGGYGALTITKAITIVGDGTLASVLVAGTNGFVVAAGPSDIVIIRNIEINGIVQTGSGGINGIRFISGGALHVENVKIYGFTQQGIEFTSSANGNLFVTNTTIRDCVGGGIWVHPVGAIANVSIERTTLDGNGRGLRVEDGSNAMVRDSQANTNTANGFVAFGNGSQPVVLTLEHVTSSNNGAAGVYSGSLSTVYISNTAVMKNGIGLQAAGGSIVSFANNSIGNNTIENNPTSTPGQK